MPTNPRYSSSVRSAIKSTWLISPGVELVILGGGMCALVFYGFLIFVSWLAVFPFLSNSVIMKKASWNYGVEGEFRLCMDTLNKYIYIVNSYFYLLIEMFEWLLNWWNVYWRTRWKIDNYMNYQYMYMYIIFI